MIVEADTRSSVISVAVGCVLPSICFQSSDVDVLCFYYFVGILILVAIAAARTSMQSIAFGFRCRFYDGIRIAVTKRICIAISVTFAARAFMHGITLAFTSRGYCSAGITVRMRWLGFCRLVFGGTVAGGAATR